MRYFTYAVSFRDLLTSLPPYWTAFLFSNCLTGLVWDIVAMFFLHCSTLLSWNIPRYFGAMRLCHSLAFSLSCWFALFVRHFSASWFGMFANFSRYLGADWT